MRWCGKKPNHNPNLVLTKFTFLHVQEFFRPVFMCFVYFLVLHQIPYLFLSTSLGTLTYNTKISSSIAAKVDDRVNALLSFDAINKRLYLYVKLQGFASYNLDGSDATTISINDVDSFTVDGRTNSIFYYHSVKQELRTRNITGGQDNKVDALFSLNNVTDLEMDTTNG